MPGREELLADGPASTVARLRMGNARLPGQDDTGGPPGKHPRPRPLPGSQWLQGANGRAFLMAAQLASRMARTFSSSADLVKGLARNSAPESRALRSEIASRV